ncbi:unnamed protein product [Callosobruchus maculatus]|uniref:1-acylglycerol-3-phosphate O-acyltransferase n=2 Tax=Callosobruchus maculatus TaxID=64391 RepID=A0A653C9C8_CALMS|nr:unnamed protein product [Callosobruchus maculatus]
MTASYTELIFVGCILLLPFLYESSQKFRYHLKFLLYYTITILNSIILIPVFCIRPKDVRNLLLASDFCKQISRVIGIKWILRGKEHLEKDQACIIISNHQSSIDILVLLHSKKKMT